MFSPNKPKGINVQLPGEKNYTFLSIPEVEKLCGITWTEDMVIDDALKNQMETIEIKSEVSIEYAKKIKHMKENPDIYASKLALRHDPRIGFYTVALEDIPAKQLISRDIGELYLHEEYKRKFGDPPINKLHSRPVLIRRVDHNDVVGVIDSEKSGNINRFHSHAPTIEELSSLEESDLPPGVTKKDIVTIQVKGMQRIDNGIWINVIEATEVIPAGCPIGVPYGLGHELTSEGKPFYLLHRKTGDPVMLVKYNRQGKIIKADELKLVDQPTPLTTPAPTPTAATSSLITTARLTGSPIHTSTEAVAESLETIDAIKAAMASIKLAVQFTLTSSLGTFIYNAPHLRASDWTDLENYFKKRPDTWHNNFIDLCKKYMEFCKQNRIEPNFPEDLKARVSPPIARI